MPIEHEPFLPAYDKATAFTFQARALRAARPVPIPTVRSRKRRAPRSRKRHAYLQFAHVARPCPKGEYPPLMRAGSQVGDHTRRSGDAPREQQESRSRSDGYPHRAHIIRGCLNVTSTTDRAADAGSEIEAHRFTYLPLGTLIGLLVGTFVVGILALLSARSLDARAVAREDVTRTLEVIAQVAELQTFLNNAETGQRGFLLTGDDAYLEPYSLAQRDLPEQIATVRRLTEGNPRQANALDRLEQLMAEKFSEMEQTLALYRSGKGAEALAMVRTDRGKAAMDAARQIVRELDEEERSLLASREENWNRAVEVSFWVSLGGSGLLLALILAASVLASRDHRAKQSLAWIRAGQVRLAVRIQGEQRLEQLGENVLDFLARYMRAQVGAIYIAEEVGSFRRFAGYALAPDMEAVTLRSGQTLLGEAARQNTPLLVTDIPADYLPVTSGAGRGKARALLIAPASVDGAVQAVIELGFFREVSPADHELLTRVSEMLGAAVRGSKDRTRLEQLLEETQRQSEELQTQQEELRVSNEELEEQGRALKVSQAQLEGQQVELEQTNSQLEEQMQMLEAQKDDLSRAQVALTEKADELERASQYKSEFLANMSHELRTPLNSSLILAKVLADNKGGNLSDEQVRFAQTITSANQDLLALINDILDLAKIEAGQVELNVESLLVGRTSENLLRGFEPLARQKKVALKLSVEPGTPERIDTDPQRLGQVLKNLLSNALKFTDRGEVSLRIFQGAEDTLHFAVRDTGLGIAKDQQGIIFDAFRQADGSVHRRYGGTGLGLSISRDLAHLLGGEITVQSAPGEGSVFTLILPRIYTARAPDDATPSVSTLTPLPAAVEAPRSTRTPAPASAKPSAGIIEDDREFLKPGGRVLLVIEDDTNFALILRDIAREMNFQCIVTQTANDGLAAAMTYLPNAIVLDMNLPDHSGMGVLDTLKRTAQTRHIPVHVASVMDYSREALELGAIGYALKPVQREALVDAFRRLEAKFSQGLKRVLVVEDDARQRDAIHQLLGSPEVQIIAVENAGAALDQLRSHTFDCMVMDLNLPDLSGYQLLERMTEQEGVSFPPVIVYTGRSLTREEEQTLRKFSRAIIVKDARSPERLLDEVMLFVHQVEASLPPESQRMLKAARDRDTALEGRRILVVEDDVRNIFALSSVLEPRGAKIQIARNGIEAIDALTRKLEPNERAIDLVLMDIMMPEMDGFTAMREIRKRAEFRKLPIIALTAKAMRDDQEKCLAAGANDYIAKPLDVDKLLSLVRVWMPH
ncbi:signal transduction histidine kinase [Panacagrimonas perspica]|uniref:histidine kinase n=1 Tax=Panacagrimonas perspica TaxID=381431 RepID=A0A4R7NYJ7_9GAMM|nr:signal transduction histidine kinase [Panacagrimonas perspica]